MHPTSDELRDLARASRRTLTTGFISFVGALLLFPALALVLTLRPDWFERAAYAATVLAGLLLMLFMRVAGQERGAFRKVFRRMKDSKKAERAAKRASGASEDAVTG